MTVSEGRAPDGRDDGQAAISTPDRRLRVFVSSTLRELADERAAVRRAVTRLRLTPVMFELGARPHPPRQLYRAYLDQSDVFVGIYARSYGWVAPGESVSGLEDEYLLSEDRPKLIYVKDVADCEPRLAQLLQRIRTDDRASYTPFNSARQLADLVADDLAVLLTEHFTGVSHDPQLDLRPGRVPVAPTAIVGRETEIAQVSALLRDGGVRLVTVVGPGGIGKTRLALEVAASMATDPAAGLDGVWFVDLTPVVEPGRVVERIATTLGVCHESSGDLLALVVDRLRGRRALLVLDNFEQVAAAAPDLGALLAAAPGITALVTSRTVLRLRGEQSVTLGTLPAPGADVGTAAIADYPAVQLFVARARQVRPTFTLTAANAAVVAALCRRLEGIPLALELAAAQLRVLSPHALLDRLGRRLDQTLDLPAGPVDLPARQRTLRATIDWSYSLLGEPERALLARLSVFGQSWTLEAAEAVGAADGDLDVLDTLSSLLGQSLVSLREQDADEPRFAMLEAVRVYARQRLVERGEREAVLRRLTTYLRGFAARAGEGLAGPDNRAWSGQVDLELEELRTAMRRGIESDDAESVVWLAAPLFSYWWSRDLMASMDAVSEAAAALPSAARLAPDGAALLLWSQGMFRVSQGRNAEAEPFLRELLSVTAVAESRLHAFALAGLAIMQLDLGNGRPDQLLDEAAATFRQLGEDWGLAFVLSIRGQVALGSGDPAAAAAIHRDALAAADRIDNDHLRGYLSDLLGMDRLASGDVAGARETFAQASALHGRLLDQEGSSYCIDGLGAVALAAQRPEAAARLFGAAQHAREVVGVSVWAGLQSLRTRVVAQAREQLDPASFEQASRDGALLSLTQALAYGLAETAAAAGAVAPQQQPTDAG